MGYHVCPENGRSCVETRSAHTSPENGRSCVETRSGHTKDHEIGNCCFSAKHTALRRKSKDWLARNQDSVRVKRHVQSSRNVSVLSDMTSKIWADFDKD